jgi:hypothetical protein
MALTKSRSMKRHLKSRKLAVISMLLAAFAGTEVVNARYTFQNLHLKSQLIRRIYIFSKTEKYIDPKDVRELRKNDGRWNLSQSDSRLGIHVTKDQAGQLMACVGEITCVTLDRGARRFATAVSVLRPDILVTTRHDFFSKNGKPEVSLRQCTFHNYLSPRTKIPFVVYHNQTKTSFHLNNFDYVALHLKTRLSGCNAFGIDKSAALLHTGDEVLSVTTSQIGMLNPISSKEPVVAKGEIKQVFEGAFGGPSMYWTDIDTASGASGGGIFALNRQGDLEVGDDERLVLKAMVIAAATGAKNGQPYRGELETGNQSILIGLDSSFMELVLKIRDELKIRNKLKVDETKLTGKNKETTSSKLERPHHIRSRRVRRRNTAKRRADCMTPYTSYYADCPVIAIL